METKTFAPHFSRVKGISDKRRLPRLGKIRMGIKAISKKSGKEFPREVDFFVCPPEVQKVFGEHPKELEIMFPINDLESVFPQSYTYYGSSKGVKCKGDGEIALRHKEMCKGDCNNHNGDTWHERICPCELLDNGCSLRGHLMFMIPKVSVGGVYQLDTGSYNSTVDMNSGIDYVTAMIGRFSLIPLFLKRVPRETHGSGSKQTHYCLQLELRIPIDKLDEIRRDTSRIVTATQYALPPAEDENPALDDGVVIELEEDEPKTVATENDVPVDFPPVTRPEETESSSVLIVGSIKQMMKEMYGERDLAMLEERTKGMCKTYEDIPATSAKKIYDVLCKEYNGISKPANP